jgi:Ca-activated chloride channel family protein
MKNENMPDIDQGQHERLCAYVFGELAGPERAAFEAELLRSPALRNAQAELVATVGLVKGAVPDEGLSEDVRRELLASARRARFRFLTGRRVLQLAAACVVVLGGALALRSWNAGRGSPGPEVRDGTHMARLRAEAPTQLVQREIDPARRADAPASAPAAPEAKAEQVAALVDEQAAHSFGLPAAPSEESPALVDALGIDTFTWRDTSSVEQPGVANEPVTLSGLTPSGGGAHAAQLTAKTAQPTLSAPFVPSTTPQASTSTGTDGFLLGRGVLGPSSPGAAAPSMRGAESRLQTPPPARLAGQGSYRGPGDSTPPSERGKTVAPTATEPLQSLRQIGYASEASEPERALLDALGYGGGSESDADQSETLREELQGGTSRELAARQTQVAAEVEQILGQCRVGAGESPRDMFFRAFGDAPFVPTLEERLSTFAADVDTASYALVRAYLNHGELPPRDAVRTEEFVNYFKADQPPPTDGSPFAIGLELAPSLFGDGRAEMLRVTVRGRDVADFQRQPLNLTLVIDNSGSMADGGRLELVKRALALLLRQLHGSDQVALVKFSNSASVVTPMIPAARRGELETLIRDLPIEGGTNVEAGLRLGYEQALASLQPRAINRVVLCSDGVGNIGETKAKELLALVAEARAQGIYLNTVGVGMGNHDDAFLEQLANEGDGLCNYVDSDAEAKRVFVDGLVSLVQPIARDVKIQVEFAPGEVESWRLLGYENRALRAEDFRNDGIDAGEVNAGHQVTALYELVRRPGSSGALATVRLRYKPPFAIDAGREGRAAAAAAEQALELERTIAGAAALPGFAAATNGYQRAALVAQLAEVLRHSVHARGDSLATLLSESRRLERVLGDPDFTEFVALLEKANPLLDGRAKEETPKAQELRDRLARAHYERALRERERELARQASEPEPDEEARREAERSAAAARDEIQHIEAELRAELYRLRGVEPPAAETLEVLEQIGYVGGDD